jgi:hypothetical protein
MEKAQPRALRCRTCSSGRIAVRETEPVTDGVATIVCLACGNAWLQDLTAEELDRLTTRAEYDPPDDDPRKGGE